MTTSERDFTATAPDRLWLTDITEHRTDEGKLYLCAIKDVCSNRIVGYSIGSRMKASLAVSALHNAISLREPAGTVVHGARRPRPAIPLQCVRQDAKSNGLKGSMERVRACADNAAMESFFSLLLKNVLDRQRWSIRAASPGHRDLDRENVPSKTPSAVTRAAKLGRV